MGTVDGEGEKPLSLQWQKKIEYQWHRTVEHAQTYPYVWASYIFVYGGLAIYTTYRWTKLRRRENRVRALQQKLKQLDEAAEEAAKSQAAALKKQDSNQLKMSTDDTGITGADRPGK